VIPLYGLCASPGNLHNHSVLHKLDTSLLLLSGKEGEYYMMGIVVCTHHSSWEGII